MSGHHHFPDGPPNVATDENPDPTVPLDEFCADLSRSRANTVELIAVFYHREKAEGRWHDSPANYQHRFDGTAALRVE
jgi:hypothetical protein